MPINFVVLDLDETLVSVDYCTEVDCDHQRFVSKQGYVHHVHSRPNLEDFLDGLDELNIQPIIFSAGNQSYVENITLILFANRKTQPVAVLHSESLVQSADYNYVKEMRTVTEKTNIPANTMIALDDHLENFKSDQRFIIKPWFRTKRRDDELLLFLDYLKTIRHN